MATRITLTVRIREMDPTGAQCQACHEVAYLRAFGLFVEGRVGEPLMYLCGDCGDDILEMG